MREIIELTDLELREVSGGRSIVSTVGMWVAGQVASWGAGQVAGAIGDAINNGGSPDYGRTDSMGNMY